MTAAGIHNTQGVSCRSKVIVYLLNFWFSGICKINMYNAAYSTCQLIHQPAGLAEEGIFRILGNFCDFRIFYCPIIIQIIEDVSYHYGKRRRGRKPGSLRNAGCGICVKTAGSIASV